MALDVTWPKSIPPSPSPAMAEKRCFTDLAANLFQRPRLLDCPVAESLGLKAVLGIGRTKDLADLVNPWRGAHER
jgi:hypothetical protein